jgi:glycosyltransferase involved in cell wall biosynthesis
MNGKIIIYAPNSHCGGGLILLKGLLETWPANAALHGYFDARARDVLRLEKQPQVKWVNASLPGRLIAEISLFKAVSSNDVVIFMNSLPPLFRCKGRVVVFMQNRNLVERLSLRDFRFKQALRIMVERWWCYTFRKRVDEYIVQTDSFRRVFENWYKRNERDKLPAVTVLPFMQDNGINDSLQEESCDKQYDFIYVADGLAHKNHVVLFDAWILLADQKIYPSLAVTLGASEFDLLEKVAVLQSSGVNIVNLGWLSHQEILSKYRASEALIFPSLRESFGLPLVEATMLGVPILASEMDYVYDVCTPKETFNPVSDRSIARAVKRFLGVPSTLNKVQPPEGFLRYMMSSKLRGSSYDKA